MKAKQLLLSLSILPVMGMAQKGFDIKGKIGNLGKPAMAVLSYQQDGIHIMDSMYLQNGKFEFKGSVGAPKTAHIRLKHDDKPDNNNPAEVSQDDVLGLFLEDTTIYINGKDSIAKAEISGSVTNDDNKYVTEMLRPYYAQYDSLNQEFLAQPASKRSDPAYVATLESRAMDLTKKIIGVKQDYARKNPNKYMSLVALASTYTDDFDAVQADSIFNAFSPMIQNSDLGKESRQKINELKVSQTGVAATDFSQPDTLGKTVKLSDFKGKYLLVDFWASWCGPCRRENPNLVKTYAKYHSKGFEVLGVSLDKAADKQKWMDAIHHDGLTWTQVSDLKGWDNEAAKLYNVEAIPMNYLIDPNGKIIAKYLRGENLDNKLEEILK